MLIKLSEIPTEGKDWLLNRQTGELNDFLKDLIGTEDYEAKFSIRPLTHNTFEVKGLVTTSLPEDCSRCGIDFKFPLKASIKEILIPEQDQDRTAKYSKANHFSDLEENEMSVTEYQGQHFNAAEFIHETIAFNSPFQALPPENEKGDCSLCLKKVRGVTFNYEDKGFHEPESPFASLKGLKI